MELQGQGTQQDRTSALAGVRVLDLSRVLAGPWCTQLLGDLGAEVIKIERPGEGDDTRGWGPPFHATAAGERSDAAYFMAANRNKRSVTIDFTHPDGQALVRRLAASSHILVENFKVGGLAKYNLDYSAIAAINPAIVYCSITGFGQTGPYAERAGYDYMIQAIGGLMSITGQPDGAPGGEPMKVGVAVADLFTGLYATVGVLAALRHAEATGQGQHIDMALLDAQIAMLANQATNHFAGLTPGRLGNAHPNIAPYQVFQTADGHIVLAVGNDGQFASFCRVADLTHLIDDPRFARSADRVANRTVLIGAIAAAMAGRSTADWIDVLGRAGVPCGPINSIDEVFKDPQVRHRTMIAEMSRPDIGPVRASACPIKLSATPPQIACAPPALGQDTDDVLEHVLGLDAASRAALRWRGAI